MRCDMCEHDNSRVKRSLERDMLECEACERTICLECAKTIAEERNMVDAPPPADANENIGHYIFRCEESEMDMCAECFNS